MQPGLSTSVEYRCPESGSEQYVHVAFSGDTSCSECGEVFDVSTTSQGVEVKRHRSYSPMSYITSEALSELNKLEYKSLKESSLPVGVGAYIAAEFMTTRALERISRRLTGENNWPEAIEALEEDYPELSSTITYPKEERNKVAHPYKSTSISTEAEQVYHTTLRMIEDILCSKDHDSS